MSEDSCTEDAHASRRALAAGTAPSRRGVLPRPHNVAARAIAARTFIAAAALALASVAVAQDPPPVAPPPIASPPTAPGAKLTVRATDVEGAPVAGATVKLFDGATEVASVTTGDDGAAALPPVPKRELRLTATAVGRFPAEGTLHADREPPARAAMRDVPDTNGTAFALDFEPELDRSGTAVVRIALQPLRTMQVTGAPKAQRVSGRIVAAEFAIRSMTGATVREVHDGTERLLGTRDAVADDEGRVEFVNLPEGATLIARVESDGRYVPTIAVDVDAERRVAAKFAADMPSLTIQGVVRDLAGKPVAGARVHVAPASAPLALADTSRPPESSARDPGGVVMGWTVTTDATGSFAFRSLDRGATYALRAEASGSSGARASPITWDLAAPPGTAPCAADLTVVPVVTLVGSLSTGDRPLSAAGEVRLSALPRDDGVERKCITKDGKFRVEGLVPGRWRIVARGAGFLPTAREIDVAASQSEPLSLNVDEGGVIEGRVVNPAGEPVPGADVHAFDPAVEAAQVIRYPIGAQHAKSDDGGAFRIAGLRPGAWNLRVLVGEGAATEVVHAEAPGKDVVVRTGPCPTLRFGVRLPEGSSRDALRLGVFRLVGDGTPYQAGEIDRESCTETIVAYRELPSDEDVIVRFVARGHPPYMQTLRLLPGEARDLGELVPPEANVLEGIVTCSDGKPLEGVSVVAERSEERITTDSEGRFRFASVAAGRQRVRVTRFKSDGYATGESEITVPCAEPARIVARRWPTLKGEVARDDGTPVSGMVVFEARRPWGRLKRPDHFEIGSDGSFEARLEPGDWIVRVFDASSDAPVLVQGVEVAEEMEEPLLLVVRPK